MKIDFKNLKEKSIERAHHYLSEFQNSQLYIRTQERYDNLSYRNQKILKGTLALLPLLFLSYLLIKPFIHSFTYQHQIKRHQTLLKDLYEIEKKQSYQKKETPPPLLAELQSRIRTILEDANLLSQQIEGIYPIQSFTTLSPKLMKKGAVQISLKKINLNQFLKFSQKFQFIHPGVFVHDLQIQWNEEQRGYLDATFFLTTLKSK